MQSYSIIIVMCSHKLLSTIVSVSVKHFYGPRHGILFRCWHSREPSSLDWLQIRIVRVTMLHLTQRASSSLCQHHYVNRCWPTWMTAWWLFYHRTLLPKPMYCDERSRSVTDGLYRNDCLLRELVCSQAFSDTLVLNVCFYNYLIGSALSP